MNKMKKSQLRKLIRETIRENKTLLREVAEVTCVFEPGQDMTSFEASCNGTAELPSNCSGNGGYGMGCSGACSINSYGSLGNNTYMSFSCMGMQVYDPPTPDFDQSFYDTWDGSYGYHPSHGVTPDKTIPGKTSNLGKAKKMVKETIKSLLLEVENYNSAEEAKQNCWMGNGDCLTDNGQAMECNQVYNTQTNTYSNSCGMAIQGGGTLTPNKDKTIDPSKIDKSEYDPRLERELQKIGFSREDIPVAKSILWGVIIGLLLSYGKEIWDWFANGMPGILWEQGIPSDLESKSKSMLKREFEKVGFSSEDAKSIHFMVWIIISLWLSKIYHGSDPFEID